MTQLSFSGYTAYGNYSKINTSSLEPSYHIIQNDTCIVDTTSKYTNIHNLIVKGFEAEIKKVFRNINFDTLIEKDKGSIVKALNKLSTKEKVTHTIWILEETKNRDAIFRNYIYNELLKVDYTKPNYIVKTLINNYFTNYKETVDSLSRKTLKLQRSMIR